jgi:hypothetical protein
VATIEACLGQAADQGDYRLLHDGTRGATSRTAWRLGQLVDDFTAINAFKTVFKLRSRYVHGEPMETISGADRTAARRLARRSVCALVGVASTAPIPTDRIAWLENLIPPPPPRPVNPPRAPKRRR